MTHGPSPAPMNVCSVHRRAVDEVPRLQPPLLALDHEHALAGDDEEVLLARLAVVHAARLAGLEHGDADAELLEVAVAFEVRPAAEPLPLPPAGVPRVEHEPARAFCAEALGQLLELRLGDHQQVRQVAFAVRAGLPPLEARVRLCGVGRRRPDARAVLRGCVVHGVDDLLLALLPDSGADHDDRARAVARPDEDVVRHRRAVDEVPLLQVPLLALDHEHALAGDDEEVLLHTLAVVHAGRHARVEHDELEAELLELGVPFEVRPATEALAPPPGHVAGVDDERSVVAHGSHPSWYGTQSACPNRAYASSGFLVSSGTLASCFAATSLTG